MLRDAEQSLQARSTRVDRTIRQKRADTTTTEAELLAHRDRLKRQDEAEERHMRSLGLDGVLPASRRRSAAPSPLAAFGLIDVASIMAGAGQPPGSVASASFSALTQSSSGDAPPQLAVPVPGYLSITKAARKRASKYVARREAREARRPNAPTERERRRGAPL